MFLRLRERHLGAPFGEAKMNRSRNARLVLSRQPSASAGRATLLIFLVSVLGFSAQATFAQTGFSGIFGGGPFYKNAAANIKEIEYSGFTEAIVWSVEVSSTGDLNLNGEFPLTSHGVYVGNQTYPDFPGDMALLKQGTVQRVTLSIGSSNVGDWQDITALVEAQGTGPGSILYQDFQALKAAIPALDAIDFDDENSYNLPTTVQFGVMLGNLGYHVLPDAYDNNTYWQSVVSEINGQLPGTADGVHLQDYAGGAGNNPCSSEWNFGSVPVYPGLWDKVDTPAEVQSRIAGWHTQCGISGGFMWLYDDFVGTGLAAKYARAMDNAVGIGGFTLSGPPTAYLNENSSAKVTIKIADFGVFKGDVSLSLSALPSGVTGSVTGTGKSRTLAFAASPDAATGFASVVVTGTSGEITQTVTFTLAVSAATGAKGAGKSVNLSPYFNLNGIYNDGTVYSTGGLDGLGYSYSANLLKGSRVINGVLFNLGPANEPDVVASNGQTVSLPQGQYTNLVLLAAGVNGNQFGETLTVHYTDGTSAQIVQDFSDWFTPQSFAGEYEAVGMPYRNFDDGTKDKRPFNLYAYPFLLNRHKVVQSITLPNDPDVVILAATLLPGQGAN